MSAQAPAFPTVPSDKNTPQQDTRSFGEEHKKHECHHYMRTYGGKVANAAMFGFGATLGADAANGMVGEVKVRPIVPSSCLLSSLLEPLRANYNEGVVEALIY